MSKSSGLRHFTCAIRSLVQTGSDFDNPTRNPKLPVLLVGSLGLREWTW
jgi:hypothetical protein